MNARLEIPSPSVLAHENKNWNINQRIFLSFVFFQSDLFCSETRGGHAQAVELNGKTDWNLFSPKAALEVLRSPSKFNQINATEARCEKDEVRFIDQFILACC